MNEKHLTRRQWLGAMGSLGAVGAAFVIGCDNSLLGGDDGGADGAAAGNDLAAGDAAALDCVAVPELTEGPFFVDEKLNRSDITAGTGEPFVTGGLPLLLELGVFRVAGSACTPVAGAQVDVWHASAEGVYSDEASGMIQSKSTLGENYLRGYQLSDAAGMTRFSTIYPGWYMGRTIHIHFKVRAGNFQFTSQLFIADTLNDVVMAKAPYNSRGSRTVRNTNDNIYGNAGARLLLDMQPSALGAGYLGRFALGLSGI